MAGNVLDVSDSNFESEVLKSDIPVLVDFWAPWCGPCRMIAPVVEKLSQEFAGKAKFVKLNVDDNPDTAQKYNITGIPALYMFKGGSDVDKVIGAAQKPVLENLISKHL
ncbi:MAG: thioredoxin [Candidatus Sericytochromatia bacterium]